MGHFMGQLQSKFFFPRNTFFCLFTSKIIDTYFLFQYYTWKFRDIIFLNLALGKIFFFQQLTVKAVLNIKCNPCTWNARKSTSFQKSYSTHFVVLFVLTIQYIFINNWFFFLIWNKFFLIFLFLNLCWSFFTMQAKFRNGKVKTVGVINL